jgi:hypothetical protein
MDDPKDPYSPPAAPIPPPPSSYKPPGEPAMGYAYDGNNKNRGGCLTAFLGLMLLANPVTAFFYVVGADWMKRAMPLAPDWAFPTLAVMGALNTAFAFGVLRWKKWGVFGIVALSVVTLIVNLVIGVAPFNAFMGFAGPAILVVLVRPLWRGFS